MVNGDFISWILSYKINMDNIDLLNRLIDNWKSNMSCNLAIPLVNILIKYYQYIKKRNILDQLNTNLKNYNNFIYIALQIFEKEDIFSYGHLTCNQAINAYKILYKNYNIDTNKIKDVFKKIQSQTGKINFYYWIDLITNKDYIDLKWYKILANFKNKKITICERCNSVMYLRKIDDCYDGQGITCDFSLKLLKCNSNENKYTFNCSSQKNDIHPFGFDFNSIYFDEYFQDLLDRRLEKRLYRQLNNFKILLGKIQCFDCNKYINRLGGLFDNYVLEDTMYYDKLKVEKNFSSFNYDISILEKTDFYCESCFNKKDLSHDKEYVNKKIAILKNDLKNYLENDNINYIKTNIELCKKTEIKSNYSTFPYPYEVERNLDIISSVLVDRTTIIFRNIMNDFANNGSYLTTKQINNLKNYLIPVKRILKKCRTWNWKFVNKSNKIKNKINVNFNELNESMSLQNNIYKCLDEKKISIEKYRKSFKKIDDFLKNEVEELKTIDLILFEINFIDFGSNLISIINKINNTYDNFYTSIEALEKSTPLSNLIEFIPVKNLNDNNDTCMICLENMSCNDEEIYCIKNCGHSYHKNCITKWLIAFNNCPLCRNN